MLCSYCLAMLFASTALSATEQKQTPAQSTAGQSTEIGALLSRPILDTAIPLKEVQAYAQSHLLPDAPGFVRRAVAEYAGISASRCSSARWSCGARPRSGFEDRCESSGSMRSKEAAGYRIRKLRYEAVPGLMIPALLYEPADLSGQVPVVLNVNGHDGDGKAADYKQIRCINLAKRGMLALNVEWFGMGQLKKPNYLHYRMNQLDLCGTSGVAPFYLAMKRGLDVLLSHEHADPSRVAVAGLSGGGWQTIFISSLDPRVTLANPVAGYSGLGTRIDYHSDLGDSEQMPTDMATVADYLHLTALAPSANLVDLQRCRQLLLPGGSCPAATCRCRPTDLRSLWLPGISAHTSITILVATTSYATIGSSCTGCSAIFSMPKIPNSIPLKSLAREEVKSAEELPWRSAGRECRFPYASLALSRQSTRQPTGRPSETPLWRGRTSSAAPAGCGSGNHLPCASHALRPPTDHWWPSEYLVAASRRPLDLAWPSN